MYQILKTGEITKLEVEGRVEILIEYGGKQKRRIRVTLKRVEAEALYRDLRNALSPSFITTLPDSTGVK